MAPKIFSIASPNDYSISTWLLVGASLQCLLVATLPRSISLLPPILLLTYRILHSFLIATGRLPNPLMKDVVPGRQTWQIPASDDTTSPDTSIVVLVLAASWSHPNGRFSPGSAPLGAYFARMWADAEANRDTYGFLGNTPGLSAAGAGTRPDAQGQTTVFLSYWKTLDGLREFAHAETHMKGQLWWERGAMDAFPHIGIMHETYQVPAGSWENVFHNYRPFGIGTSCLSEWGLVGEYTVNALFLLQRVPSTPCLGQMVSMVATIMERRLWSGLVGYDRRIGRTGRRCWVGWAEASRCSVRQFYRRRSAMGSVGGL